MVSFVILRYGIYFTFDNTDRDSFQQLIQHVFKEAGYQTTLLSDSSIETLRITSGDRPRNIYRILTHALQLAMHKNLNHLPDDLIQEAIDILKG